MTLEEAVRDYTLNISSLHKLSDDKLKICGYLESWPPALLRQLYVGRSVCGYYDGYATYNDKEYTSLLYRHGIWSSVYRSLSHRSKRRA